MLNLTENALCESKKIDACIKQFSGLKVQCYAGFGKLALIVKTCTVITQKRLMGEG